MTFFATVLEVWRPSRDATSFSGGDHEGTPGASTKHAVFGGIYKNEMKGSRPPAWTPSSVPDPRQRTQLDSISATVAAGSSTSTISRA